MRGVDVFGCSVISYDDALERFHRTGPEFDGFLSNHGPMFLEVLARRDQDPLIGRWTTSAAVLAAYAPP